MSDDLIARMNRTADWLIEHEAVASAILVQDARDELLQLRVLARRVYAECGPVEDDEFVFWECPRCYQHSGTLETINHKPDCLWLAAEAVLRKAGEI